MPVSAYEFGAVIICYALLVLLPAGLIKYVLREEHQSRNKDQILSALLIYPIFISIWALFVGFLDRMYGEAISNLYIALLVSLIFSWLLLLTLKKFWFES